MSNNHVNHQHILVMKVGPYCEYDLNEIIKIKQEEELSCGKFFWGYGGVFCRPYIINSFVSHAQHNNSKPVVLLSTTLSAYDIPDKGKFTHYSSDKSKWITLPKEVLLVGKKSAPHFAIVAKNLKKIDTTINLSDYCTLVGMFPDTNKYLDNYFRYRVDKACGVYSPRENAEEKVLSISYVCELEEPYGVYIK